MTAAEVNAVTSEPEPSPRRKRGLMDRFIDGIELVAAFFVGIVEFEPEGGKTRYTATVRHWTGEDVKKHEATGFHQGWGMCADQLEALARTI